MRAFLAAGLALFALGVAAQPPSGDPNIVPRVRGKNPDAAESVTDRHANIRAR
jgi:hypothetical protein